MGTGRGKKPDYQAQENKAYADTQTAIAGVKPTEVETKLNTNALSFLNDQQAGKDVRDYSSLAPQLSLFDNAKNLQNQERFGTGLFQLGSRGASGGASNPFAERMRQVQAERRSQDAAGQLSNAYNMKNAEVTGQTIPFLAQMEQNRSSTKIGANASLHNAFMQRPKEVPFWQRLITSGIGAASQLGSAAITAGAV